MSEQEQQLTEWDSSKATLIRIDDALRKAALASFMGDLPAWYKELQVLKREAYPKMPKKQTDHTKCKLNPTEEKTYCQRCHCDNIFKDLESNMTLTRKHKGTGLTEIESKLDRAELFLRDFMDSKGMLMRDSKSALDKFKAGG